MKKGFLLAVNGILTAFPALAAGAVTGPGDIGSLKFIAAGLAVGLACIGAGVAIGKVGAAALGALSEKPELFGKAVTFLGLAEGICLWGFLVAVLILFL